MTQHVPSHSNMSINSTCINNLKTAGAVFYTQIDSDVMSMPAVLAAMT